MKYLTPAKFCRLSGRSLEDASVLFEIENCPLPGVYPSSKKLAKKLISPVKVVQARESKFVQLGYVLDQSLYSKYAFSGGGSKVYSEHLEWVANQVESSVSKGGKILEVGCGDGTLLNILSAMGFENLVGIDPSLAALSSDHKNVVSGYFPNDLPAYVEKGSIDLLICRHVLEHVEDPVSFASSLSSYLSPSGKLWIEVPDLDEAVDKGLWTNFYQLHCNYFCCNTLDQVASKAGLCNVGSEIVNVFGGSLFNRYEFGTGKESGVVRVQEDILERVNQYRINLAKQLNSMPEDCCGYGAAERTAMMFGLCPNYKNKLSCLYDGNSLLNGRWFPGTSLEIKRKERLFEEPPQGIVLFALSNVTEIISEWKDLLPPSTLIAIPNDDFSVKPLIDY